MKSDVNQNVTYCQLLHHNASYKLRLVFDSRWLSHFGYSWIFLAPDTRVNAVWILHTECEVAFRLRWWPLNQMKSGWAVDKWTHLSSSSPFARVEAAEDHYLPQRIHHTVTWPNDKHRIMTSIDPVTDFCPPPYTLTHLSSILLSTASIYCSEDEEETDREPNPLPARLATMSGP